MSLNSARKCLHVEVLRIVMTVRILMIDNGMESGNQKFPAPQTGRQIDQGQSIILTGREAGKRGDQVVRLFSGRNNGRLPDPRLNILYTHKQPGLGGCIGTLLNLNIQLL